MSNSSQARAAQVARASYGKLLAVLAKQTNDIASAEDALAEAFARALETWPSKGIPDNPEAWLITTAKNKMRDRFKSAAYKTNISLDSEDMIEPAMHDIDPHEIPDERLKLLFVCAHPAIDEKIRTPLMLQTVLGLEAKQIADAFLVPTATMAQRLVRAKGKIKDARIPFVLPEQSQMPSRLNTVLEAVYGTYAIEWESKDSQNDLGNEALFLADLLVELLPTDAEVLGLAALLNYSTSRQQELNEFVPLHQQNPANWDKLRANRADNLLARAKSQNQLGRFQLEAAIQSVHSNRRKIGTTDWVAIVQLYEGLLQLAPTIGAAVAQAAAVGEAYGSDVGLRQLKTIDPKAVEHHQAYWAVKAHLSAKEGSRKEAVSAFERAIDLTANPAVRTYLENRMAAI